MREQQQLHKDALIEDRRVHLLHELHLLALWMWPPAGPTPVGVHVWTLTVSTDQPMRKAH